MIMQTTAVKRTAIHHDMTTHDKVMLMDIFSIRPGSGPTREIELSHIDNQSMCMSPSGLKHVDVLMQSPCPNEIKSTSKLPENGPSTPTPHSRPLDTGTPTRTAPLAPRRWKKLEYK